MNIAWTLYCIYALSAVVTAGLVCNELSKV